MDPRWSGEGGIGMRRRISKFPVQLTILRVLAGTLKADNEAWEPTGAELRLCLSRLVFGHNHSHAADARRHQFSQNSAVYSATGVGGCWNSALMIVTILPPPTASKFMLSFLCC